MTGSPITKAPETPRDSDIKFVLNTLRLSHSAENISLARGLLISLIPVSYDSLARELEQMREALTTLDARLRECMNDPIEVSEAYDSFYQDMVSAALQVKPSNEVGT